MNVIHREQNVFPIEKVSILDGTIFVVVLVNSFRNMTQPLLAVADSILAKDHVDHFRTGRNGQIILVHFVSLASDAVLRKHGKIDQMEIKIRKVLFRFGT